MLASGSIFKSEVTEKTHGGVTHPMELSCPLGARRALSRAIITRALSRKENFSGFGLLPHIKNPLLTKLVQSRWLDIGLVRSLVHFLRVYGTSTSSRSINTQKKEVGQYLAILTSRLVNNPYLLYA